MQVHFHPAPLSPRKGLEKLWSQEIIGHQNGELVKTGQAVRGDEVRSRAQETQDPVPHGFGLWPGHLAPLALSFLISKGTIGQTGASQKQGASRLLSKEVTGT